MPGIFREIALPYDSCMRVYKVCPCTRTHAVYIGTYFILEIEFGCEFSFSFDLFYYIAFGRPLSRCCTYARHDNSDAP